MTTKSCLILILLSFVVSSCMLDSTDREPLKDNEILDNAKYEFEHFAEDLQLPSSPYAKASTKSLDYNISPDWSEAKLYKGNKILTIAAPFWGTNYSAVVTETVGAKKRAIEEGIKASVELVMQKGSGENGYVRFVSTLVGKNSDGSDLSYLTDKSLFSGYEILSDEKGRIGSVRYWYKGKFLQLRLRLQRLSWDQKKECLYQQLSTGIVIACNRIGTRSSGSGYATGECDEEYCFECHSYTHYVDGKCYRCGASMMELDFEFDVFCSNCGKRVSECHCVPCDVCGQYNCICVQNRCIFCGEEDCDGSCQNGLGNTGGGSNGVNNPGSAVNNQIQIGIDHMPHSTDTFVLNRDTILQSIGLVVQNNNGMCIPACLEYLSLLLGNTISQDDFLLEYVIMYIQANSSSTTDEQFQDLVSLLMSNRGLSEMLYVTTIINNHFIAYSLNQSDNIFTIINDHYPIMAFFPTGEMDDKGNDILHSVVIVGYTADNNILFMDPQTGGLKECDESLLNFNYLFAYDQVK